MTSSATKRRPAKSDAGTPKKPARRGKGDTAIGDDAVRAATGKGWTEWFALLDNAGAAKLDHKGIVAILDRQHKVRPWWRQMVTVQYERERGLRQVYETPRGFSVSVSRTIAAPVSKVYEAWLSAASRKAWLPRATFTIRKATRDKSLRITWGDGTNVEVMFYLKGAGKSQCTVQHDKLPRAASVETARACWSDALDALRGQFA